MFLLNRPFSCRGERNKNVSTDLIDDVVDNIIGQSCGFEMKYSWSNFSADARSARWTRRILQNRLILQPAYRSKSKQIVTHMPAQCHYSITIFLAFAMLLAMSVCILNDFTFLMTLLMVFVWWTDCLCSQLHDIISHYWRRIVIADILYILVTICWLRGTVYLLCCQLRKQRQ